MSLSSEARARIEAAAGARIARDSPLGGGCIADLRRVTLADGRVLVAKLGRGLALEAWMLGRLRALSGAPVPAVHHAADDLLLMDFIANEGSLSSAAEADLGAVVATLHGVAGTQFGFERDTVIGSLPQPNPAAADWRDFFRDHRLLAMARTAHAADRLPARTLARIDRLAARLQRWIDGPSAPVLIHGDLWSGNILARGGRIVGLIDPALYYADPEIELAFMTLFGSVGERFFRSYGERHAIRPGFFEARRDLYNLYPLLVHVRLFGGSYVGQVERILDRFGA